MAQTIEKGQPAFLLLAKPAGITSETKLMAIIYDRHGNVIDSRCSPTYGGITSDVLVQENNIRVILTPSVSLALSDTTSTQFNQCKLFNCEGEPVLIATLDIAVSNPTSANVSDTYNYRSAIFTTEVTTNEEEGVAGVTFNSPELLPREVLITLLDPETTDASVGLDVNFANGNLNAFSDMVDLNPTTKSCLFILPIEMVKARAKAANDNSFQIWITAGTNCKFKMLVRSDNMAVV